MSPCQLLWKNLAFLLTLKLDSTIFMSFCNGLSNGLNNPIMLQSYNASKILRGASCQEKHYKNVATNVLKSCLGEKFKWSRVRPRWSYIFLIFFVVYIHLFIIVKACVRYFLSIFIFSSNDRPSKTMEKCFLFHLKSFFRSQDIQISVIFSLPFHTFQIQKGKWKWNNLWCHKLACTNLQM